MGHSAPADGNRSAIFLLIGTAAILCLCLNLGADSPTPSQEQASLPFNAKVGLGDWPQFGGTPQRNNVPLAGNLPIDWDVTTGRNLKWSAPLGSHTFGTPVVANGRVFVGTNNGAGYLKRYPPDVDLGVLLCLRETDGEFLWQFSAEKLPAGRVHDWPLQGIVSTPVVEGDRVWLVSNRGEVVCLDAEGFRDRENDGPFVSEKPEELKGPWEEAHEADVVWKFDMMRELVVRQHNMASCSPTIWGDVLFICTSNGVDESHSNIPSPEAPSFMAMNKHTGKVLWTDNSPGKNILHGQWSSPAVGVFNQIPQVLFAGGDGWLYSFRADRWNAGKPELLWKFDGNHKTAIRIPGARSMRLRDHILATPVIHDGLVYLVMGEDPEHGERPGYLWCLDPTKRGDVSWELVVDQFGNAVPPQRLDPTAPIGKLQPRAIPNPNSAVVWHYGYHDQNGDGKVDFEEIMHRGLSGPTIRNGILMISDLSGVLHCLHPKTGKVHWTHDWLDTTWGGVLMTDRHAYCGSENGDIHIFELSTVKKQLAQINMDSSVYSTPIVANNVLYFANKSELFAIATGERGLRRVPRSKK